MQVFIYINNRVHIMDITPNNGLLQADDIYDRLDYIGVPSNLYQLYSNGRVIKRGTLLHLSVPNIYAKIPCFGGMPITTRKRRKGDEDKSTDDDDIDSGEVSVRPTVREILTCNKCGKNPRTRHLKGWKDEALRAWALEHHGKSKYKCEIDSGYCDSCNKQFKRRCESEMSGELDYSTPSKFSKHSDVLNVTCFVSDSQNGQCCGNIRKRMYSDTMTPSLLPCFKLDLNTNLPESLYVCEGHHRIFDHYLRPRNCALCKGCITDPETATKITSLESLNVYAKKLGCEQSTISDFNEYSQVCKSCNPRFYEFRKSSENLVTFKAKFEDELDSLPDEDDVYRRAELQTLLKLVNSLLVKQEALLQPEVVSWFEEFHRDLELKKLDTLSGEGASYYKFSTEDELDNKARRFKYHMFKRFEGSLTKRKSSNPNLGIMIIPPSFDNSAALDQLHTILAERWKTSSSKRPKLRPSTISSTETLNSAQASFTSALQSICVELSQKLDQSSSSVKDRYNAEDVSDTNFFDFIDLTDPYLWNLLVILTSSKGDRNKILNSSKFSWGTHWKKESLTKIEDIRKEARRLFILYSMMFSQMEGQCNPLHLLVADKVDKYSLSSELMEFMNRLGLCVSVDTHKRFMMEKSELHGEPETRLEPDAFTVVTIDNIDKESHFSKVRAGPNEKRRGMHDTSITYMQPKPSSMKDCAFVTEKSDSDLGTETSSSLGARKPRTLAEAGKTSEVNVPKLVVPPMPVRTPRESVTIDQFSVTQDECQELENFKNGAKLFVLEREVNSQVKEDQESQKLPGLRPNLLLHSDKFMENLEQSNVVYWDILAQPADNKDTLLDILAMIEEKRKLNKPVIAAGDAKTYQYLVSLKYELGSQLDFLYPYLGEFHTLLNFQKVLLKIYQDAGLMEVSGAKSKNIGQIFRHNQDFILQVWEAIYRCQISAFLKWRDNPHRPSDSGCCFNSVDLVQEIQRCIDTFPENPTSDSEGVQHFLMRERELKDSIDGLWDEFDKFTEEMSSKSETFKFWNRFLHEDCTMYIGLWIAVRSENWQLRNACLKKIASLFHAFDHQNYSRIIPQHLYDLCLMPSSILSHLQKGGFAISLKGVPFYSVALDEAHETTINKDVKSALSIPDDDYVVAKSRYLPYRANWFQKVDKQLQPHKFDRKFLDFSPSIIQLELRNISQYQTKFKNACVNPFDYNIDETSNNGLKHIFTGKLASKEQRTDLLEYHQIGQKSLEHYIEFSILKKSSKTYILKKKNLRTFAPIKRNKQKQKQQMKDLSLEAMHYKRRCALSEALNKPVSDVGQICEIPRAIAQPNLMPLKGTKANATNFIDKRYSPKPTAPAQDPNADQTVDQNQIQQHDNSSQGNHDKVPILYNIDNFFPEAVILEGMFMIAGRPVGSSKTFGDYANQLMKRWIYSWFSKRATEVHVVFDDPGRHGLSPKDIERARRDASQDGPGLTIDDIQENTKLPDSSKWQEFLSDRESKRKLCAFLSTYWCSILEMQLKNYPHLGLQFFCGGGFTGEHRDATFSVDCQGIRKVFGGNHEESDSRVWLHAAKTTKTKVLIYSPDTDTYMVGVPLVHELDKSIIVQLSAVPGKCKYVNMQQLVEALEKDPELSDFESPSSRAYYLQVLYASSGCDYVSYFAGLGKTTFFKHAMESSNFISA